MGSKGFTLLETMIAMAIMMVAFSSILMVESASINTSIKTKQMNIVSLLAKRAMVEAEQELEGKTFDEIQKEKTEQFKEPFQDYKLSRTIKELKFPGLSMKSGDGEKGGDSDGGSDSYAEQLTKLVTQFLSKAVREVTVSISWKKGAGEQSFSVSTYWVNFNQEFTID